MSLGEQIAVLDGLDAFDPTDGRIGQMRAQVDEYGSPVMPGVLMRRNVLDASEGANYSGGSSYAPRLPLLPSSVGLAGFGNIPNVLPMRRNVIDPSGGANYTGGSDWVPGLPLIASSAGLAADFIAGGYGRAGLGAAFIAGGYGRAGLGQTASAADEDLAGAAEAVATARALNPEDGRIGQTRAQVDEYGNPIMPGVLQRSNVLDPSEGANYAGGSSYAAGLPLMPSSVGLAGLEDYDDLDGLSDLEIWGKLLRIRGMSRVRKVAGKSALFAIKRRMRQAAKRARTSRSPRMSVIARMRLQVLGRKLASARRVRRSLYSQRFAARGPQWAR